MKASLIILAFKRFFDEAKDIKFYNFLKLAKIFKKEFQNIFQKKRRTQKSKKR